MRGTAQKPLKQAGIGTTSNTVIVERMMLLCNRRERQHVGACQRQETSQSIFEREFDTTVDQTEGVNDPILDRFGNICTLTLLLHLEMSMEAFEEGANLLQQLRLDIWQVHDRAIYIQRIFDMAREFHVRGTLCSCPSGVNRAISRSIRHARKPLIAAGVPHTIGKAPGGDTALKHILECIQGAERPRSDAFEEPKTTGDYPKSRGEMSCVHRLMMLTPGGLIRSVAMANWVTADIFVRLAVGCSAMQEDRTVNELILDCKHKLGSTASEQRRASSSHSLRTHDDWKQSQAKKVKSG